MKNSYILHILAQQVIGKMATIQWTGTGTSQWFSASDVSVKPLGALLFYSSSIRGRRASTGHNCQSACIVKDLFCGLDPPLPSFSSTSYEATCQVQQQQ